MKYNMMKYNMKDLYGEGELESHEGCPKCGYCITCGDCQEFGCKK